MTIPAQRANMRLIESHSLPIRTHHRDSGVQLDPFTGKPKGSPLIREAQIRRVRDGKGQFKMPKWSKARGTF